MILDQNTNKTFTGRFFLLMAFILLVSALGGLSLVWLRQESALIADQGQAYEKEIARLERRLHLLDAKIATVHQPEFLKELARRRGLTLVAPNGRQTVHLPAPSRRKTFVSEEPEESLFSSYNLALYSIESYFQETE